MNCLSKEEFFGYFKSKYSLRSTAWRNQNYIMYWLLVVAGQFISKVANWANPRAGCMDFLKPWAFALLCGYAFPDVEADRACALPLRGGWVARKETLLRSYTGYSNPWNNSNENTPPSPRKNLKIALETRRERKRISENSLLFVAFLKLRSHCLSGAVEGQGPQAPEYVPNGL